MHNISLHEFHVRTLRINIDINIYDTFIMNSFELSVIIYNANRFFIFLQYVKCIRINRFEIDGTI